MIWYLATATLFCLVELRLLSPYLRYMPRFPFEHRLNGDGKIIARNNWRRQFAFILLCLPPVVLTIDIGSDLGWSGSDWPTKQAFSASLMGVFGIFLGRTSRHRDNESLFDGIETGKNNSKEYKEIRERLMKLKGESAITELRQFITQSELNLLHDELEKLKTKKDKIDKNNRDLKSNLRKNQLAISKFKTDIENGKKRVTNIRDEIDKTESETKELKKRLNRAMKVEKKANENLQEMLRNRDLMLNGIRKKRLEAKQKKSLTKLGETYAQGQNRKPARKKK